VAGDGSSGFKGDGGDATSARLGDTYDGLSHLSWNEYKWCRCRYIWEYRIWGYYITDENLIVFVW
jgi:hypothetical protein